MADPTLRLTYSDLRIRVAVFLGVADYSGGSAALPTDASDLELVGRLVNDGYARFLTENERGWNFMTVPLSITFGTGTVAADNSRYYLPDDSDGRIVTPFTYGPTGPTARIIQISEPELRELKRLAATGFPVACASRAINTDATATGSRWEMVFYPTPTGTETVTALYKRFPAALSAASDRSVAGFVHDRTVLTACIAEAELQVNDTPGPREAAYQRELRKSLKIDARAASPHSRDYGDRSDEGGWVGRPKTFFGVDTYNGNSIL
jgi:hypothetical protein